MREDLLIQTFETYGVIPVIKVNHFKNALPMADALIEGGLPLTEITFRTNIAAQVISELRSERPDLTVGAGTITTTRQLFQAKEAGASFGLSPGFDPCIVQKAREINFPFFPGVMTPSEIQQGMVHHLKLLKFFPAEQAGGVQLLKAIHSPYSSTGIRFLPTGGVTLQNLESYLSMDSVIAVGGTWIADEAAIDAQKFDLIKSNAKKACQVVNAVKGEKG